MSVRILIGDVREQLKTLPDESVHCVVTSPPYWGLRDFGVDGGIGLESSLDEHLAIIVEVFREVRRVLRKDGTLWLNYGDAYAAGHGGSTTEGNYTPKVSRQRPSAMRDREDVDVGGWGKSDASLRLVRAGIKAKDLIGLPWRVAFALQADGWWLRQDIIWSKPNPMPESVTDRCTKAHEYIFLMTRSARYAYDAEAIKEAASDGTHARRSTKMPDGWDTGDGAHGSFHRAGREKGKMRKLAAPGSGTKNNSSFDEARAVMPSDRNKRSVWEIATAPFPEAHFATFPPKLIEPCIKAGCPKGGTVLDPFGGAGTTGLVADRLGRDAILIELNPTYAEMARKRIARDAGMFGDVA